MRFNQLKREIGITATTLGRRLEEMINQGLVDREVFAEVPARVEYQLSEKGRHLGQSSNPFLNGLEAIIPRVIQK
jgi:DNA-binding HxlR family transcriptional regulator